jgi:predicted TIM-barrel fold metal-dependent hydrolase
MTTSPIAEPLFDAHLHLDDRVAGGAENAVRHLLSQMDEAGVSHAVVLQLRWQRWHVEEVAEALAGQPRLIGFVNIDPTTPALDRQLEQARALGYRGLKLHPRLQRHRPDDPRCIELVRAAGSLGWPALLDAFPDGEWLMDGLTVQHYGRLAREAPEARVIVAHAAGHHCIDLMMIAKRVPNLWFDISYSWLYYHERIVADMAYCIRSMRGERVLFGTDYPDRSLPDSISMSLSRLAQHGVSDELQRKLLWENAQCLLRPTTA